MKFFLILLFLVFSFSANPTDAYAYVVLGEIKVLRELTKEDIEAEIRNLKITEDPKKVIKLKFGVPEAAKKNNSVINLYTPFHIVIDPPLAGDLEVFYNSSQSRVQKELSKGQLMFSKKAIRSEKTVVFPQKRRKGIMLHKQSFIRIDVVISQPEGPVTYTRFFQTQPLASENNRIYLGTFSDFERANRLGEIVLRRNRDVIDKYEIKAIDRKEDKALRFRVIAETTGSPSEADKVCSVLLKRKFACFVINSK